MHRALHFLRRSTRKLLLSHQAESENAKTTVKRKEYTRSYTELWNLPSAGTEALQDATSGNLKWMMDYDPLP